MNSFFADLRFAARALLKSPGFTATAVLTLALGIGANTAMFSVINGTLLSPLPYPDADRIVRIWETTPEGNRFSASEPNFLDFRASNNSFQALAAFKDVSLTFTGNGEPARIEGLAVSRDFFSVLGHAPVRGRAFTPDEDAPGSNAATVILSHDLWQRRFNGADLVGSTIRLEGRAQAVIGIMPPDFDFLGAGYWVPLAADPAADRGDHWLGMIGRLQPGVSPRAAKSELESITASIGEAHPTIAGWGVAMETFPRWLVGDAFRTTVYMLFGAVGFLLLMACVNLANLLFARASRRQTELSVRMALGAARGRLVRQMLAESLLLAGLGVMAGLALAYWGLNIMKALDPGSIPRLEAIRVDANVMAFAGALGVITTLLFGLMPALRISGVNLDAALREGGRAGTGREHRRLRDGLVVVQVALAMLLLAGAGLLIRSFMQLQAADPGFDANQVVMVEVQLGDDYAEPWEKVAFFNGLIEDITGRAGVISAGATAIEPFSGNSFMNDVTPVGRAAEATESGYMQAHWRTATPELFETLNIPLHKGRLFTRADRWDGPRVAVITVSMAERMWPGEEAVGREFYWGNTSGEPLRVIGVVGDFQDVRIQSEPQPLMFLPYHHLPWPKMTLMVRGTGNPDQLATLVRDRIRAMDPALPVPAVHRLEAQVAASVAGPRFRTLLLGAFSLIALLLAAVGIYGVMACNVSERTREIGLRMALGAKPGAIAGMLLRRGVVLTLTGTVIGLAGAWGLTRFIQGLLFATAPLDPSALMVAGLVLTGTALAACYLPARRAARVQPTEALRYE